MNMSNDSTPELKITIFSDIKARTKKEITLTEDIINGSLERATKKNLPLLKMGTFGDERTIKGALRHDANLLSITGVELDYDEGKVSFQDAMEKLELYGVKALGYTSPSYRRDHPKWRILLPFSQEYTGSIDFMRSLSLGAVAEVEDLLHITFPTESKKLSQSFFFGRARDAQEYDWRITDGDPIDIVVDDLAARGFLESGPEHQSEGVDLLEQAERISSGEDFHEAQLKVSSHLAAKGVDPGVIIDIMRTQMEASGAAQDERWQRRYEDIPRMVESAIHKFAPDQSDFEPPAQDNEKDEAKAPTVRANAELFDLHEELPPQRWVVDRLVPEGELALFTGAPGTGKSFLLLEMQARIALGEPVLDIFPTEPGIVWYIGAEDDRDRVYRRRLKAWYDQQPQHTQDRHQELMERTFYFHPATDFPGNFQFTDQDGIDKHALNWMVRTAKQIANNQPLTVIADPLMSFFGGESENSSADMQALVTFFRQFNARTNATTILCHHDAKGQDSSENVGDKMGRGSSAMFGGVRSGFRLWKPSARDLLDRTGRNVSEEDARHSFVALSQGKSNYGEHARTVFLKRGTGGILGAVDTIDPEVQYEMDWDQYGELAREVLLEEDGLTARSVERNLGMVASRMCMDEIKAPGTRMAGMLEWAANMGHITFEETKRGTAKYICRAANNS